MRRLPSFLTTALIAPFLLPLHLPQPLQAQGFTQAQSPAVWVQIEAAPTLTQAQDRIRSYAARLPDVAGYDLGNGWYGVVLGPYAGADAEAVLRRLRALGDIPADSYLTAGDNFTRQYWPVGLPANQGLRPLPAGLGGFETPAPDLPPPVVTGDAMLDALAADLAATLAETLQTDAFGETAGAESAGVEAGTPAPDALIEVEADTALPEASAPATPPLPEVTFPNAPADESEREAAASEAALSQFEKEDLQTALKWAGFYTGGIDGLFGRGTRSAMSAWQSAQGFNPTGILTTRERALLLGSYHADLFGLDLALVSDPEAGIDVIMPMAAVRHTETAPPFVIYDSTGAVAGAQVILISQPGDGRRLAGLYEIIQALETTPPRGPRSLTADNFTIQGADARVQSYTHVALSNGEIKGFSLIWPAGDLRFARLWNEMRQSLRATTGVLPAATPAPDDLRQLDLASGLSLRRPQAVGAGVFLNSNGAILTDAGLVDTCNRIDVAGGHEAQITYRDPALGIAVLQPATRLTPSRVAQFDGAPITTGERLAVGGYPYGAALLSATLTFGQAAGAGGLQGEAHVTRLTLNAAAGDTGGPIFDTSGAVVGLFSLPAAPDGQILPPDLGLARNSAAIMDSLRGAGIGFDTFAGGAEIAAPTLTRQANDMVVQVACW